MGHPTTTQNSLPGAGYALLDGLAYPQGFNERFPKCFLHHFPLSRASLAQSPFLLSELFFVAQPPQFRRGGQLIGRWGIGSRRLVAHPAAPLRVTVLVE